MATSWIVQGLRAVAADLQQSGDWNSISYEAADGYRWRIELMYRELLALELVSDLQDHEREALGYLAQAYQKISQFVDSMSPSDVGDRPFQALVVLRGNLGRPSFEIPLSQLKYLIECRFSVPKIAQIMDVSVSTVRRRMSAYNLSIRDTYSTLSDVELDAIVLQKQNEFPNWGNRQMYGYLISRGIRVQFSRVRESQSRIDPEGSVMRRLQHLQHRSYSVRGPQHLWHIDGNHKLIRSYDMLYNR